MKLLVLTIGFDEKLPLRGILKLGVSEGDTILLVYSKTGGEFEVRKVEKAVETLKDIVSKAGAKTEDLVVSGLDFYRDVATILGALRQHRVDEVVAVLAGGMRILVYEALVALVLWYRLAGVRSRIHVAREDGLYDITTPVDLFYVKLSSRENAVLKKLTELGEMKRSALVDEVSREQGISESMVYKVLKSLSKKKLVAIEDDTVKLTELGRLVYEAAKRE